MENAGGEFVTRFYILTDIHSCCKEAVQALTEKGFFDDKDAKLIVCGDYLDRGKEPHETVDFLLKIKREGRLILIRGNHEDLFEDALADVEMSGFDYVLSDGVSVTNGTVGTFLALANMTREQALASPLTLAKRIKKSDFYNEILPECKDYFETENYVFTHGWIPCEAYRAEKPYDVYGNGQMQTFGYKAYRYNSGWRNASLAKWKEARFLNGMDMAVKHKITVPYKTVVCGHFTTSYGHSVLGKSLERTHTRYSVGADFSPFYAKGIIALDGIVFHSGVMNCIVIEDNEL